MALNTIAAGRAWLYSHNIGRNAQAGMGFSNPVGVALAPSGIAYVANRSGEQNPSSRISKVNYVEQEFITEFGRTGPAYGGGGSHHFTWLTGVVIDSQENVYTSDEWKSQISAFDSEGNLLSGLGREGQRVTASWTAPPASPWMPTKTSGSSTPTTTASRSSPRTDSFSAGSARAERPMGSSTSPMASAWTAQATSTSPTGATTAFRSAPPDGAFLMTFGHGGKGAGSLNHPTGVCVDGDGDVYVVDWLNERVVIYDEDSKPITYLYGDAVEVSKWGEIGLNSNPDMVKRRNQVQDQVEQQRKFRLPTGCAFDVENNRLVICDTQRGRLQVYIKDHSYQDPQFNL